jgi:hypothetical protein
MRLKPIIIVVLGMAIVTAAVIYWPTSQTTTQQQGKGGKGKRFAGPPSTEPVPVRATVARRAIRSISTASAPRAHSTPFW